MTTAHDIDYEWFLRRVNNHPLLSRMRHIELIEDILSERYDIPDNGDVRCNLFNDIMEIIKVIATLTYDKIMAAPGSRLWHTSDRWHR